MTLCKAPEKIPKIVFLKISIFRCVSFLYCRNVRKKWNIQKIDFFRFSQRPCKWSKNVFRGELTLVRCFFFRSWIMDKVSHTLKIPLFWFPKTCILACCNLLVRPKSLFCINNVTIHKHKNRKNCQKFEILLETWRITSGLSADSFMDL